MDRAEVRRTILGLLEGVGKEVSDELEATEAEFLAGTGRLHQVIKVKESKIRLEYLLREVGVFFDRLDGHPTVVVEPTPGDGGTVCSSQS